jgi:tetratricopeptide (TPR) repeat protein
MRTSAIFGERRRVKEKATAMATWSEAGRLLRELRQARGWNVARLAVDLQTQAKRLERSLPSVESLVRMVRDWEAGVHRPRDYYDLFVMVYATAEQLASRTVEEGSELDRLMSALSLMGVSMDRRTFLLNSAALSIGAALETGAQEGLSMLDLFDDDPVPHAVGRLRYLVRHLRWSGEPAEQVYRLLLHHAKDLATQAARFPGTDIGRELRAVQARTLSAAGLAAFFDLGNHAKAEKDFRAGMDAAKQSSDPRLRARLCVNLAHRRLHDKRGDVRTSLYDALLVLNSGLPYADENPSVLADVYDMQAVVHAALGDGYHAGASLDNAAAEIQSANAVSDAPEWLPNVNDMQIRVTAGISYLWLGEPERAVNQLVPALNDMGGNRLHATLVLAHAAQAFAKLREPERAVNLIQQAIPTVSKSKSVLRTKEIQAARSALMPWDGESFVRELDEQFAGAGLA